MINVEAEVSKYKNCKDRDDVTRAITEYKNLALQNAHDMVMAGRYNTVALKLQEICDKLPAPRLKNTAARTQNIQTKTANITKEEKTKISSDWKRRTGTKK